MVADSFEAAREAGYKVRVDYDDRDARAPASTAPAPRPSAKSRRKAKGSRKVGDAAAAFAAAPVKIDARYSTPTQHHNPIELFTTTCVWDGPKLTIYEPTQGLYGLRAAVAKQFGIDQDMVRTVSRYVGGGFGSKGAPSARTAWIALAAKRLGRPVKLVADPRAGLHHRHLPRRNPPPPAPGRLARRQAHGADPRGLGGHLAAVEIQRLRRRRRPRACTLAPTSRRR